MSRARLRQGQRQHSSNERYSCDVTLQIADTICIAITEHGDVDFVDDRISIPERNGGVTRASWQRREQTGCNYQTGHRDRAEREHERRQHTLLERLDLLRNDIHSSPAHGSFFSLTFRIGDGCSSVCMILPHSTRTFRFCTHAHVR